MSTSEDIQREIDEESATTVRDNILSTSPRAHLLIAATAQADKPNDPEVMETAAINLMWAIAKFADLLVSRTEG